MTLQLQIKYSPHKGQNSFHADTSRFRILACGRRWGKTICGANETIKQVTLSPEGAVIFCVAPTYWHTQKMWREILTYCPQELIVSVNRAEPSITLIGNRKIWFKSADNPDSLRSEGLDFLWVDEGAQINEEAWTLALRPALMDKHGRAIFTGTPKGKNWYFQLWTRGQDKQQHDYKSWTFPSSNNPYLDPKEIAEFARDMPEMALRQELYAEFLEDVGSVFRNVEDLVKGSLEPPQTNKTYVAGCDLAKHKDYTVIYILDNNGHLCALDRFSELDWNLQQQRIISSVQQYKARLLIDSTGVGDPIFDSLLRRQIHVEGYKFTSASKAELIENLSMMIDQKALSIPGKPRVFKDGKMIRESESDVPELINELKLFGYTKTKGGTIQYGAPSGYHDDCVIAWALAAWQLRRKGDIHGWVLG
jgi:phage FluMu gp28-like protein